MPQRLKSILKIGLSLLLTGTFLWAAFHDVDLARFWMEIQHAQMTWLLPVIGVMIGSNVFRAWRWQTLMAPITRAVSLWHTFLAVQIGYAGNNVFPRAGEVARVLALRQGRNLPLSGLLATVLVERVLDLIALVLLLGLALRFAHTGIAAEFPWLGGAGLVAFGGSLALLTLFGLLSAYPDGVLSLTRRILGRVSGSLADRLCGILRAFLQGMAALHTRAGYIQIGATTLLLNACYLFSVYIPFYSFDFPARYDLGLNAALVVMVISTIGIILPTPGGAGTYHFFCSQALHRLYGVPLPEALAFATVLHGIVYFTFLLTGGPGLLGLLLRTPRFGVEPAPPVR